MNLPKPKLTDLNVSASRLTSDPRWRKVLLAAAVLLAIAIAIPVLLSQPGKPAALAALPPAPTVTTTDVVATVTGSRRPTVSRAKVTGAAHNPFRSASNASTQAASSGASTTSTSSTATTSTTVTPGRTSVTGGQSSSTHATSTLSETSGASTRIKQKSVATHAGANSTSKQKSSTARTGAHATTKQKSSTTAAGSHAKPVATHTVTVVKTVTKPAPYSSYQADVTLRRQGAAYGMSYMRIARDQLLPADDGAFATFLGVRTDAKTAVFMLANGIDVSGDGRCAPSVVNCTFLTIEPQHSVTLKAPEWAGGKTFVLTYHAVSKVTSSASVIDVDDSGLAVVKRAGVELKALRSMTYGRFDGLLDMSIGRTLSAAP